MKRSLLALAATVCCVVSHLTHAALGESVSTVSTDQIKMVAARQEKAGSSYTVQEMTLPSTTVVREYVAGGKVFAVTWRGPVTPNIRQLLGSYVDQAVSGTKDFRATHGGGIGPVSVTSGDFVFQSGGHMGFYVGRAYITTAMPAGVTAADIR